MSIHRTIQCNITGCHETYTEAAPGAGFPQWGALQGRVNDTTGELHFHLCPFHLARLFEIAVKELI